MKLAIIIVGLVAAIVTGIALSASGQNHDIAWTAGVVVLCACWWIFEPIPIPVTSLIPVAVFPAVGVLSAEQTAGAYGNSLVLLMLGGFMLSTAMERSGAHQRIAMMMVRAFGGAAGGRRLVFGFMAAAAFLSMWISNAATVLMLLPIVMAVVKETSDHKLQTCLLLGVAYGSSIGGIATPIGTPPNLVFMEVYVLNAGGTAPTFSTWMMWTLPIVLVMVPTACFWLTRRLTSEGGLKVPVAGPWRYDEIATLSIFSMTALCWMTRLEPFGGWSDWLGLPGASDAGVALLAVVVMHLWPDGKGKTLLTWENASQIPWGVLILFGGGIAIARAFVESGLSQLLGDSLSGLSELPVLLMVALVCLVVTFLTEVTSNTATANLLLPILAVAALASGVNPLLLMVPATISCSFAFMLPVATPPNAIVFGSEKLTTREMAREGFVLNLIGVVVVSVICWFTVG